MNSLSPASVDAEGYRSRIDDFERALFSGQHPRIEQFLSSGLDECLPLLEELLHIEIEYRGKRGDAFDLTDYCDRFPSVFNDLKVKDRLQDTYSKRARRVPCIPGYQLHKCLGAGGMGVVYSATREDTDFEYAIKMMLADRNDSLEDLIRFRIEAEAYACLDHQYIIKIRDVGVVSGCPYLAMDFAANGSLDHYIQRVPELDIEWRVRIISKAAEALSHAHGRQILHRDLKPANILIAADGDPRITDFGLVKFSAPISRVSEICCTRPPNALHDHLLAVAKERERHFTLNEVNYDTIIQSISTEYSQNRGFKSESIGGEKLRNFVVQSLESRKDSEKMDSLLNGRTRVGTVMGSPEFMSPEQAEGAIGRIGPRTDVYGLGATLYQILTNRPPIQGQGVYETISNVIKQNPTPPTELNNAIPQSLSRIVMKALEKKPENRFPSMDAFGEALDRVITGRKTISFWHSNTASQKNNILSFAKRIASSVSTLFPRRSEANERTDTWEHVGDPKSESDLK